jgi:hypothetical protein
MLAEDFQRTPRTNARAECESTSPTIHARSRSANEGWFVG